MNLRINTIDKVKIIYTSIKNQFGQEYVIFMKNKITNIIT